jgi:2-keto-4-pentenoate hydratase/2-oxohepta-3-ene-1,7-dioic acid hydratase in catechol pathway
MKLITFTRNGSTRIGIVMDDGVVDLSVVAPELPGEMTAFLAGGPAAWAVAHTAARRATARLALDDVRIRAPILRPPKFLGVGLNYAGHIAESGRPQPTFPTFFNKQSTCVIATADPIHRPRVSTELDYEGELGVVIGQRCRHVPIDRATEVIAGYLVVNDVSVRDWQFRTPTMTLGKSFDTHGPIGPWIVTSDEIGDPHALGLRTLVNGELRQRARTSELVFNCFDLVATLSAVCTLEPGDIISTGTPAGVGGASRPPRFLVPGDVVRIEIDGIGHIENPVIDEPPAPPLPAR